MVNTIPKWTVGEVLSSADLDAYFAKSLCDTTAVTVTAATTTNLSRSLVIAAGEAGVGTGYRLTASGTGTQATGTAVAATASAFLGAISIDGSGTSITAAQIAAAGVAFSWRFVVEMLVTATGSSGTVNSTVSGLIMNSAGTVMSSFVSSDTGSAMDTTTSNSLVLTWKWASTTGAPTITCQQTMFERLGG